MVTPHLVHPRPPGTEMALPTDRGPGRTRRLRAARTQPTRPARACPWSPDQERMSKPINMLKPIRNQRGQVLAAAAVTILALFTIAAIAVDTGHLVHTLNELHIVADSAATAGATTLFNQNGDTTSVTADATTVAIQNFLNGQFATASDLLFVEPGNLDGGGVFTPDATPSNAVQVCGVTEVHNYLGWTIPTLRAIDRCYGKVATAVLAPISTSTPDSQDATGAVVQGSLPLSIGDSNFSPQPDCRPAAQGGNLPQLNNVVVGTSNTEWTSFSNAPPLTPNLLVTYLPAACAGGAITPPPPSLPARDQSGDRFRHRPAHCYPSLSRGESFHQPVQDTRLWGCRWILEGFCDHCDRRGRSRYRHHHREGCM